MLPSVRCGLEGALLSALADARRQPLHVLLAGSLLTSARSALGIAVNALLHSQGTPEERAAEARRLVCQGYKTLKVKVRRSFASSWRPSLFAYLWRYHWL